MRLNRFFGDFDFSKEIIKISDKEIFNQLKNVLRMKVGDRVVLCDGNLNEAISQIVGLNKNFIEFKVIKIEKNKNESKIYTILYCSILKKENFEIVVQKVTEIGIKEIIPIICANTVKLNLKEKRLRKIIKEAAEQSGRGLLPILNKPLFFDEAINKAKQNNLNIFFDINGLSFDQILNNNQVSKIGIWIGPEGGWTNSEIKLAKENDFKIISLGKLTLRAETAAILGSYFITYLLKENF